MVLRDAASAKGRSDGSGGQIEITDRGAGALRIESRVVMRDVMEALAKMSEARRSVIVLRELCDMTYEEIVEVMGLSMSSVKVTLHRARRELRANLSEDEDGVG